MRRQQDVMIIFCDELNYYWAKKFATPELLNSTTKDEQPFISYLIENCYMSERILKAFVKKGAKIPSNILHNVVMGANHRLVPFLVKSGADINARNGEGKTPLWCALLYRYLPVVETLLEAGAEIPTDLPEKSDRNLVAAFVRCHIAKDAFTVCAKKHGVSRDMTNLIGQFIWGSRRAEEWL